jgi:cobalt-zinc-cadmium efflux system membrane fusion protein
LTNPSDHIDPLPVAAVLKPARQRHVLALVAVALCALAALYLLVNWLLTPVPVEAEKLPPDTFRPTAQQLSSLTIAPVSFGENAEVLSASGSIAADGDHSTPILLPYSGQVVKVMIEPGQHVDKGQALLSVASPELVDARNALLTGSAQVTSGEEAVRMAEANAARQKGIYQSAGGALKDYLQAQGDLVTARANLRASQSALGAARDRLGLFGKSAAEIGALQSPSRKLDPQAATVFRSPVAGTIADRNVAPGQFLSAGGSTPIITVADLSRVWLVAQLSESDAARVQLGDVVSVTTPSVPGRVFSARIDNIGASLDPNTHRLPVRATIDNPGQLLKPQMFASFAIHRPLSGNSGVLAPSSAIIHEGDTARVWVLGRDRLLHARPVEVADSAGGFSRIVRGLRLGDRVVTKGALFVNEAGLDQ